MISYHARGVAEPVAPSPDTAPGVAPSDNATAGSAPPGPGGREYTFAEIGRLPLDQQRAMAERYGLGWAPPVVAASAPAQDAPPRRHGSWSRRCPLCLSTALLVARTGVLECAACAAVLPPPSRDLDLPLWELDLRVQPWDAYSRPGRLLEEWGRSTDRESAGFTGPDATTEAPAPRVRAEAVLGLQDAQLDADIRHHTEQTQALVVALDTMRRYMGRLHGDAPAKRGRTSSKKPGRARLDLGELLLEHTSEVVGEPAPSSEVSAAAPPSWFGPLCAAIHAALQGELRAMAIIAVNALRRRGVEYDGSLDQIHPRLQRAEPYAGLRHAIRGAFGTNDTSSGSSIPFSAMGTHKLPQGVQFGRMAVKPSKVRAAAPREPSTNAGDVWDAIRAARVGARTRWEGGQLVREPGRPLTEAEIELVRLVDGGLVSLAITERRGGITRVVSDAVEQLHPRDAVVRLQGLEGAPRTEHEARIMLKAARRAIAHVLEDRELIPALARDKGAPSRSRAPSSDPFAGVGSIS
jgi:hypothetical protein